MVHHIISAEYNNLATVICIPLIIAIFAFALPLLLNAVDRIDKKYNSVSLVKLFYKEKICRFFISCLILSIVFIVIFVCQIPRSLDFGPLNFIVENSAILLLFCSTTMLLISTISTTWAIFKYNIPTDLFYRLEKKYKNSHNSKRKGMFFEGISQILYFSINQYNEELARICLEFYFSEFIDFRKGKTGNKIIYPTEFYDTAFEANELLCKRDRQTISYYNDGTIYECFFDGFQRTLISKETYSLLWRCLVRNVYFKRDDFVFSYWKKAHQYCSLFLNNPIPYNNETTNGKEIKTLKQERKLFLEFHYALGGLLLYKERYNLLSNLLSYSHMMPPKYVLFPETLSEVIECFMNISKSDNLNPTYFIQKYPFPDISGVNGNSTIQMWIESYLAILFLRQFTLHEYYIYSDTLRNPNIPKELSELARWKEGLDRLKHLVNEYLNNRTILSQLGMEDLSYKCWFSLNSKEHPDTLIDRIKAEVQKAYIHIIEKQEIAIEKEQQFEDKSLTIIQNTFERYKAIENKFPIENDYKNISLSGRYMILDKMAFANQQDMDYANSDSITAEYVSHEIVSLVFTAFLLMERKKYTLHSLDAFKSIKKLNLNKKNFVIIALDLNLDYYRNSYNITELKEDPSGNWTYDNINIIQTNSAQSPLSQSLILISTNDLPSIVHKDINKQRKIKYELKEIDSQYHIYTSIINLDKNEQVRKECEESTHIEDIQKKVLACIDHNTEIRYRTSAKCIQLKIYNQFDDRETANNIEDVKSIW